MLATGVAADLAADHDDDALFPAYKDYSFANVTPTVLSLLGADTDRSLPERVFEGVGTDVATVVLVLLDGYGWEHWTRDYGSVPLLSRVTDAGTVTPLTSVFPSETAAAMTTFHTGSTPVEHGLLGWWQYVDQIDAVVESLPFTTLDGEPADEAYPDARREQLFDDESLYPAAADDGVSTRVHLPFPADGPESEGTESVVYDSPAELGVRLRRGLEAPDGPDYLYGYVPNVDAVAHEVGTTDDRYRAELEMVTESLRRELARVDDAVADRTLFVLTADHGMVDTTVSENVDLGSASAIWDNLRRDGDGDPIPPVGSPRNVHLFLRDGATPTVRAALESRYDCRTFTRAEALDRGLFGDGDPSDRFRRRCGDLVVVHRNRGMWWDDDELELVGMHGGLTREEMLVPFAAARLGNLSFRADARTR